MTINKRIVGSGLGVVALCGLLASMNVGCASGSAHLPVAASSTSSTPAPNIAFWSAPCNLADTWDTTAQASLPTYAEPTLPSDSYFRKYGPVIANETCSDGEILQWQALRRGRGESDEICKIAWVVADISAAVYDLGCTRPAVVIEP